MMPIAMVSNAMLASSTAHLDWMSAKAVGDYMRRSITLLGMLCVAVGAIGVIIGPTLLAAVLGKSFEGASWMIPWLTFNIMLQAIAGQLHTAVQLSGASSAFVLIQSVDAALRLALVFAGALVLGELGIIAGMLACSLGKAVWSAYALSRQLRGSELAGG
jgi:O-antigen/teichoic acid export membrane protein